MAKHLKNLSFLKEKVRDFYNKFSSEYDDSSHASIQYNESLEDFVVMNLVPENCQNLRFLDVGCGTGRWLKKFHELECRDLVGFDISEEMLKVAKKKFLNSSHPRLIQGDAEYLSAYFPSERFDIILASFCDHILNQEKFFFETRQVLKKDGKLIISFPAKELASILRPYILGISVSKTKFRLQDGNTYVVPSFVYTPAELKNVLRAVGYKSIEVRQVRVGEGSEKPPLPIARVAQILKKPIEEIPVVTVGEAMID